MMFSKKLTLDSEGYLSLGVRKLHWHTWRYGTDKSFRKISEWQDEGNFVPQMRNVGLVRSESNLNILAGVPRRSVYLVNK